MARICMVVWNDFRNDARVLKEAQTLQKAGHSVTVFALHTPGVTRQHETLADGIEVKRVHRSILARWKKSHSAASTPSSSAAAAGQQRISSARILARLISRSWVHGGLLMKMIVEKAEVIHAHDVNTLPTAWLAAKLSRAGIVYDAHEISSSREGYGDRIRHLVGQVERFLMPRVDGVITTTETRAKFFSRAYRIPRPLVLQNRPRYHMKGVSQKIRQTLKLPKSWPIVLYQGGLQQGRGLERIIQAARRIDNAYFVFIGDGRLSQTLKTLAVEQEVTDRVFFIPTVALDELLVYTESADIGVQPIKNTCFNHFSTDSNKLFEYIQAGLPVVATNFPEIRRIVLRYRVGKLVPENDDDELTHAIACLVNESEVRARFAENTTEAAKLLNWETQEEKLLFFYSDILSARMSR